MTPPPLTVSLPEDPPPSTRDLVIKGLSLLEPSWGRSTITTGIRGRPIRVILLILHATTCQESGNHWKHTCKPLKSSHGIWKHDRRNLKGALRYTPVGFVTARPSYFHSFYIHSLGYIVYIIYTFYYVYLLYTAAYPPPPSMNLFSLVAMVTSTFPDDNQRDQVLSRRQLVTARFAV